MDNLRSLLGIRKAYRIPNALGTELYGMKMIIVEMIGESVPLKFGVNERTGNGRTAKGYMNGSVWKMVKDRKDVESRRRDRRL